MEREGQGGVTDGFFAFRFFLPFDTPPPEMPTSYCSYCEYDPCEATTDDRAYRDGCAVVVGWLDVRCSGWGENCGRYDGDPVYRRRGTGRGRGGRGRHRLQASRTATPRHPRGGSRRSTNDILTRDQTVPSRRLTDVYLKPIQLRISQHNRWLPHGPPLGSDASPGPESLSS